jgi:hypothetical protein
MVQCEISVRWQLDEKACRSLVAILPNPEHASLRRDQVWQSRASRLPRRLECPLASPDRRQRAFVGEIGAAGEQSQHRPARFSLPRPSRIAVIADSPLPDACKLR